MKPGLHPQRATIAVPPYRFEVAIDQAGGLDCSVDGAVVEPVRTLDRPSGLIYRLGPHEVELEQLQPFSCRARIDGGPWGAELFPPRAGAHWVHGHADTLLQYAPAAAAGAGVVAVAAMLLGGPAQREICAGVMIGALWAVLVPLHWRLQLSIPSLSLFTLPLVVFAALLVNRWFGPYTPSAIAFVQELAITATVLASLFWLARPLIRRFLRGPSSN